MSDKTKVFEISAWVELDEEAVKIYQNADARGKIIMLCTVVLSEAVSNNVDPDLVTFRPLPHPEDRDLDCDEPCDECDGSCNDSTGVQ